MSNKGKNVVLWLIAIVLTLSLVIYQRSTGPTYPVRGEVTIENEDVKFRLIRSFSIGEDSLIKITTENKDITGSITLKRYKSYDEWSTTPLIRNGNDLIGIIPTQPMAGKVEYNVVLHYNGVDYKLNEEPVITRFKGAVPKSILVPHIFFMFMSLLFALRTGLEIFFRGIDTKYYSGVVLLTLLIGGLILGPIVQKYAFDAYWTGWPFGHDLTDNKTLFVFIFWVIAWFVLRKKPQNKLWPVLAVLAMLLVYAIPHSVLGSEIDHRKQNTEEVK